MGAPLNRIPNGLLNYFGVPSGTVGPRELGELLSPVLELRDWYMNFSAIEVSLASAAVVVNTAAATLPLTSSTHPELITGGNLVVPNGEYWLIHESNFGWSFQAAAGQAARLWFSFNQFSPPQPVVGEVVSNATVAATGNAGLERPIWMRPGQTISLSHSGILVAAGAVTPFGGRMRLSRFLV